jgi:hypothetical protein
MARTSPMSPVPLACAIGPVVPMRRQLKPVEYKREDHGPDSNGADIGWIGKMPDDGGTDRAKQRHGHVRRGGSLRPAGKTPGDRA